MPLRTLIAQIVVIVLVARIVGWLFRKIGQPHVMGEMVAGMLLGPSLLGRVAPQLSAMLFAPDLLVGLSALSEIGLLIFMFLTGLKLDPRVVRGRRRAVVVTSHASIVIPFLLGCGLAIYLYPRLATGGVSLTHFALFMGMAMSITAFPVLARILTEKQLLGTHVGSVALACAAVDDVTAWLILAGVLLSVRASSVSIPLWLTLVGTVLFVLLMIVGARRLFRAFERNFRALRGTISERALVIILLVVLAAAWITESLGIHALFGAFLVGAVMPKDHAFVQRLNDKLEDFTVVLLLPLFFALTGLKTSFSLLSGAEMWLLTAAVVVVAVVGKFGGAALSARATGMTWREAGALGVLMNTRGLMELVVLNIGLDIGIVSVSLFTMMVMMALVTTFMTSPLLDWINPPRLRSEAARDALETVTATGESTLPG